MSTSKRFGRLADGPIARLRRKRQKQEAEWEREANAPPRRLPKFRRSSLPLSLLLPGWGGLFGRKGA